jgi:hypothetical protein
LDKDVYSGNFADFKAKYGPIFDWLGVDQNKVSNSQQYQAQAEELVVKKVKRLGSNPTDRDVEVIKQTIPTLSMQSNARKELINYLRRVATNDVNNYNTAYSYFKKNKTLEGFGGGTGSGNW